MREKKHHRPLALILCAAMLISQSGATAYAEGTGTGSAGGLCEHHAEHIGCSYVESEPGHPCEHEHTEDCYTDELICGIDEIPTETASGSDTDHTHTQDCHALDCPHENGEHDANCRYMEGVNGQACDHVCDICTADQEKDSGATGTNNGNSLPAPEETKPGTLPLEDTDIITVTAFEELGSNVKVQTVAKGTKLENLNLPAALVASGYRVNDAEVPLGGIGPDDTAPVPETITITGVMWELTGEKDTPTDYEDGRTTPCSYYFQPVLPKGYTLAEGTELPKIAVRYGWGYRAGGQISGNGYVYDGNGKLTISSSVGMTNWRHDSKIDKTTVTSVEVQNGITAIDDSTFTGCANLEQASLPSSLKTIGIAVFFNCSKLELSSLPASVTSIGKNAFQNCSSLALSSLPSGLTSIEESVFRGCSNLTLSSLPANIISIGDTAFFGCSSLALASLPSKVNSIGESAFYNCSNLALTSLPNSITHIGKGAFFSCRGLTSLTFASVNAPTLGTTAFYNIPNLTIFVPDGATGYDSDGWAAYNDKVVYGAALSDLTISEGSFNTDFFPGRYDYAVTVPNSVDSVTVTPTAHASETILVNDIEVPSGTASAPIPLEVGVNTDINIIAANDATDQNTYTITVTRAKSADATLKSLSLSSGTLTPVFVPSITNYTATVDNSVSNVSITAEANHTNATITGDGTKTLNVGENSFTVSVTAEDKTTTQNYTIIITRAASADATLKSLSLSSGTLTPVFDSSTTSYTATVDNNVSSVSIFAEANHTNAAITGDGTKNLNVGENTFTVSVTAEDKTTTQNYTIIITRAASADATLKSLSLSSGTLTPDFDSSITSYTANVDNSVSNVSITAEANHTNADVTGVGDKNLNVGENTFTVSVTAENKTTTKDYTIIITRAASADATLKSLSLSSGTLTPVFDSSITSYTATVDNSVSSVSISAEANHTNAGITGDGTKNLNVGENTFTVSVTAEDNTTTQNYTIIITREASADATLKSLSLSSGTLTPVFVPSTANYTATVGNSVSIVSIIAEANDTNATITGDGMKTLSVGENTFTVTVTAEDGSRQDYTVSITRASYSGSDSSDSDSSYGHTITTPVLSVIELPVTVENGTAAGQLDDGRTAAAITGAQKDNKARIGGIAIQYDAKTAASYDGFSIRIGRAALDRLIAAQVKYVTLNTGIVDLTFDLAALQEIQKQTTGDITLTVTRETGLTGDALAAVGTRPAYRLTVNYTGNDGQPAAVQSFGAGRVTVGMAYQPAATEQTGSLFLVYSKDGKGAEWLYRSSYDENSGNVVGSTGHFSLFGVGCRPAPAFADTANHWAKADIEFVATRDLLTGASSTTFTPDGNITRGTLVTALGRLAGIDPAAYPSSRFTDVAATACYAPYVEWAVSAGIVSGTGEMSFSPDAAITREQMAVMIQQYADKLGYTLPVAREAERFTDEWQITSGMKNAVQAIQQAGLMNSKDGHRFGPKDNVTRAETAAVLRRFVEIIINPA